MPRSISVLHLATKLALFAILLFLGWRTSIAAAAGTDPTLALSSAVAFTSSQGVVSVRVGGTFNFDDLLQFPFPSGLIVFQGDHFARFEYAGGVVSGDAGFLADGLDATELALLLTSGSPAPSPAALVRLEPTRIAAALPSGFVAGAATVVVYAVLENTSFLSNAVTFDIPRP